VYPNFISDIKRFNEAFGVESNETPVDLGADRLEHFINIYCDELDEYHDIKSDPRTDLDARVALADWLSDLYVYLSSEARRWGHPYAVNGNICFDHDNLRTFYFRQGQLVMDHLQVENLPYALYSLGLQTASIAQRYNIPLDRTLKAVMDSQFSKFGADGKPIIDSTGKIRKGPDFKPPEEEIRRILIEHLQH